MKLISAYDWLPRLTSLGALLLLLLVNQVRAHEPCTSFEFARRPNQALAGHAFKTLELGVDQCMNKCAKTVGCFSVNTYQTEGGVQQCELLRSTMKASPRDFVIKPGYEYFEMMGCDLPDCLFADKKGFPLSSVLAQWKLDGTDKDVTLHSGASFNVLNGMTALYLDTSGYAEIPAVAIGTISFTFAIWVKWQYNNVYQTVFSDWLSPYQFLFEVTPSGPLRFFLRNPSQTSIVAGGDFGSVIRDQWIHIGVSWNRETIEAQFFVNGKLMGTMSGSSNLDSIDLQSTDRAVYQIGSRSVTTSYRFYGYMRDLIIFRKALTEDEMAQVPGSFDRTSGVWIGLNDVSSEGTFVWSDGSDETHREWTSGEPNDAFSIEDCAVVTRDGKWEDNRCEKELPFICKTPP